VKFGRNYRITIDPKDGGPVIVIAMPLTVQFWMKRNTMASLNYMSIDVYNLGKSIRDRLFQDRFFVRDKTITFEGGYDSLSLMYSGNITECSSAREGTNIITRIESLVGVYDVASTLTFQTLDKGKTLKDVFNFLTGEFPTLQRGAIGDYDEVLLRPVTLNGNTYELLKKYSNGDVFIDNGKVYVLKRNEVVDADIPIIDIDTGLLETPRRDDAFLSITTLFEPRVTMKQKIELKSAIMPVYNGTYAVCGIMHQGTISEAVNGSCRSVFDLIIGNKTFKRIAGNG
jgi:hypothetical protein